MHREADLLEIVRALRLPRGFARALYRRQHERDQHADDSDDDQYLDERKAQRETSILTVWLLSYQMNTLKSWVFATDLAHFSTFVDYEVRSRKSIEPGAQDYFACYNRDAAKTALPEHP